MKTLVPSQTGSLGKFAIIYTKDRMVSFEGQSYVDFVLIWGGRKKIASMRDGLAILSDEVISDVSNGNLEFYSIDPQQNHIVKGTSEI